MSTIIHFVSYILAVSLGPRYIQLPTNEEEVIHENRCFEAGTEMYMYMG